MRHSTDDLQINVQRQSAPSGSLLSLGIMTAQRLIRSVSPYLLRALWGMTHPRLYVGVAVVAWLGVLFAPELKERYLHAHPELRHQVAARVASEWGQRARGGLELEMNALGGEVPSELRLFQPEGVIYLSGGRDEGCVGALIKPRVALSSARCVERVRPDLASWGPTTGAESARVLEVKRDPSGELALLRLSAVTPLPTLALQRDSSALSAAGAERPLQRDDLNVVLYLSTSTPTEGRWRRAPSPMVKAALWVPQRSTRAPQARARALEALYTHPGGALLMSRAHRLEGIMTTRGVIEIASRRAWLHEASEALSTRHSTSTLRGARLTGARPLASRSL